MCLCVSSKTSSLVAYYRTWGSTEEKTINVSWEDCERLNIVSELSLERAEKEKAILRGGIQ